ncbi:MAG: hypothetical protein JRI68_02335 [Deltaproteobacteria bacterium]|nr:hypothetical protein [Deltaproteobacteria bacterium]
MRTLRPSAAPRGLTAAALSLGALLAAVPAVADIAPSQIQACTVRGVGAPCYVAGTTAGQCVRDQPDSLPRCEPGADPITPSAPQPKAATSPPATGAAATPASSPPATPGGCRAAPGRDPLGAPSPWWLLALGTVGLVVVRLRRPGR